MRTRGALPRISTIQHLISISPQCADSPHNVLIIFLLIVTRQIKNLDENLMATLGQIMLLVQGLYSARKGMAPGKLAVEGQEQAAEEDS